MLPASPILGFGLGLRAPHYEQVLNARPRNVDWFEIISENFMEMHEGYTAMLQDLRRDYPLVLHGVSLSLGSTDTLNTDYLRKLKNLADAVDAAMVSDHLCFTGVHGRNTHDLLPVPLTEAALTHVVGRVKAVQDTLGRRLYIENPSSYLEFAESTIPEGEFLARLAEVADCGLLLDVNNIYVSSVNHGFDAVEYLGAIPAARIGYVHLAGHSRKEGYLLDTHDHPVPEPVWNLYRRALQQKGALNTMVEWDDLIPEFDILTAELDKARAIARQEGKNKTTQPPPLLGLEARKTDGCPSVFLVPGVGEGGEEPDSELSSLPPHLTSPPKGGRDIRAELQADILHNRREPVTPLKAHPQLSAAQQLAIYAGGYRARLEKVLIHSYPATVALLGAQAFAQRARDYIETTPSTHYNIDRYALGFGDSAATWAERDAAALARLEQAVNVIFLLPDSTPLTPQMLAGIDEGAFAAMPLRLRAASRLLQTEYAVNDYLSAFRELPPSSLRGRDETVPDRKIIEKRTQYLLIYRHDRQMQRVVLEPQAYRLLSQLAQGQTLAQALDALETEIAPEWLGAQFQHWLSAGVFSAPE